MIVPEITYLFIKILLRIENFYFFSYLLHKFSNDFIEPYEPFYVQLDRL